MDIFKIDVPCPNCEFIIKGCLLRELKDGSRLYCSKCNQYIEIKDENSEEFQDSLESVESSLKQLGFS